MSAAEWRRFAGLLRDRAARVGAPNASALREIASAAHEIGFDSCSVCGEPEAAYAHSKEARDRAAVADSAPIPVGAGPNVTRMVDIVRGPGHKFVPYGKAVHA